MLLVVSSESPYRTLDELVAVARRRPGLITYASTGPGSILALAAEMLQWSAGIRFLHIPYAQGPQALVDLGSQRVDVMFNPFNVVMPQVRDGRLRALGITSMRRSRVLPETPTFAEQGFSDMEVLTWGGLVAPAATPDDRIARLNAAANAALEMPGPRQTLLDSGYDIVGGTAAAFGAFLRQERRKWTEVAARQRDAASLSEPRQPGSAASGRGETQHQRRGAVASGTRRTDSPRPARRRWRGRGTDRRRGAAIPRSNAMYRPLPAPIATSCSSSGRSATMSAAGPIALKKCAPAASTSRRIARRRQGQRLRGLPGPSPRHRLQRRQCLRQLLRTGRIALRAQGQERQPVRARDDGSVRRPGARVMDRAGRDLVAAERSAAADHDLVFVDVVVVGLEHEAGPVLDQEGLRLARAGGRVQEERPPDRAAGAELLARALHLLQRDEPGHGRRQSANARSPISSRAATRSAVPKPSVNRR